MKCGNCPNDYEHKGEITTITTKVIINTKIKITKQVCYDASYDLSACDEVEPSKSIWQLITQKILLINLNKKT